MDTNSDSDEEVSNRFGDKVPNNLTASFSQYNTKNAVSQPKPDKPDRSFCLKDLEASQLRNDLDESQLDAEEIDDIQRSHMVEGQPNRFVKDNGVSDKSLGLSQLDQSQYTYSKNTTQP